jgi:purine-binding chemotaxis protein CheW
MTAAMTGASGSESVTADLQAIVLGLGDEIYGIEIGFVQEIIRNQPLTAVPGASPAVLGLINLRSQVLPVLSLRTIFGRPAIAVDPAARIVLVGLAGWRVGLLVDEVFEVRTLAADSIQPAPAFATGERGFQAVGIAQTERGLVVLLDIEAVLGSVELGQAV